MKAFTLLLSLSLFLWTHTTQAAVLCTKKGGAVFVRESCKVHETPVDPAILGIQPSLAVYDATGKKVGDVLDIEPTFARVFISFNQYPLLLYVSYRGDYLSGGFSALYFESSDCTGMPLLHWRGDGDEKLFVNDVVVSHPGHTLYIADPLATSSVFTIIKSMYPPRDPVCRLFSEEHEYHPAISIGNLDTVFTPPFSVR